MTGASSGDTASVPCHIKFVQSSCVDKINKHNRALPKWSKFKGGLLHSRGVLKPEESTNVPTQFDFVKMDESLQVLNFSINSCTPRMP